MTSTAPVTFVVRFWREAPAGHVRWRGQIEHVQSGQSAAFLDLEAMLRFLRRFGVDVDEAGWHAPDDVRGVGQRR